MSKIGELKSFVEKLYAEQYHLPVRITKVKDGIYVHLYDGHSIMKFFVNITDFEYSKEYVKEYIENVDDRIVHQLEGR